MFNKNTEVMIESYKDFQVHKVGFSLDMVIFWKTRNVTKEEIDSLTSQYVCSSPAVSANIGEGWGKRQYEAIFNQQPINALGSNSETQEWLDYALACRCIGKEEHSEFTKQNEQIGKMLTKLYQNWKSYE